ncbi:MAG TPA: hypothetical protein VEB66_10465, partial [Opitutaceae bacterium]|nr:hypothetical protein [Opitutaceae bacterium]
TTAVTTAGLHDFNQRALVNQGMFNWSAGQIRAGNGASFTNSAVFNDAATSQFNAAYGGTWTFINPADGSYQKTSGATTFASGVAFHNAGLLSVSSATLTLDGGGDLSGGTIHAGTGGVVDISSSFVGNGKVTLSGPGDIRFTAGTFSGATAFEGPLNWVSGNFNGSGSTVFGTTATVAVTSANEHDFNQRTLVNDGVFNWSDGQIRAGNGASFINEGVFNDAATSQFNSAYGGSWTFVNSAESFYHKTGGAMTSTSGRWPTTDR